MTTATETTGSWFSSGYHGHFRSKSRTDFICEYRQIAKPHPPKAFLKKAKEQTAKHAFSHHDNRNSFMTDAQYFEQGLGRRRSPTRRYDFDPNFISWHAEKEKIARRRPVSSTYRKNFKQTVTSNIPQIIVKRPMTSFEGVAHSSYQYYHCGRQPNKTLIDAAANAALLLSAHQRQQTRNAQTGRFEPSESVASCLKWHPPVPPSQPKRTIIPAATQTTDFTSMQPVLSNGTGASQTIVTSCT